MGRPCAACLHPRATEINAQIAAGATAKAVAAVVGLKATAVARHRRVCLATPVLSETEQLRMWASRADEAYLMSGANADVKSMCAALAAGLRTLELSFKRKEELEKAQSARDLPLDTQLWTAEEGTRFRAYMDHILATTKLPVSLDALVQAALQLEGENHEHFDRLPIRN